MSKPSRIPSKQLVRSTTIGASIGSAVEIIAAVAGVPLPPGTGTTLAALITAGAHYFQKQGRKASEKP